MQLSKVTSWGLILGGLWASVGMFAFFFGVLGLSEDAQPAEEFKKLQDSQAVAVAFFIICVGLFVYLMKSFVQLGEAVNVTGEWHLYLRIMALLMVGSLLLSLSTWLLVGEDATFEKQETLDLVGHSINTLFIVSSAFVQLIIAWFALKNGLGNLIFKVFVGILGVLSAVDIVNLILNGNDENDLAFVTWILWAVAVVAIGITGLVTKKEA